LSDAILLRGASLVTPDGIVPGGALGATGGAIDYAGPAADAPAEGREIVELAGGYLLPGFIDLHLHGGGGYDVTGGRYDPGTRALVAGEEDLRAAVDVVVTTHARHGTTAATLATWAAPHALLVRALETIGEAAAHPRTPGRVLGVNIEGTFLKDPAYAGAQQPENFQAPSVELFDEFNRAAGGAVRVVNIAPEFGESSIRFIRHLVECGVTPSTGHTGATAEEMNAAVDAGVRLAVHLTNGPLASSTKPPGMALEVLLTREEVTCELICDGRHVDPRYVVSILAAKRMDCAAVTDAMFAVDVPGIRRFVFGAQEGEVAPDGSCARVLGKPNTLFSSTLTLDRALRNLVAWLAGPVHGIYHGGPAITPVPSRDEAICLASRLLSERPAHVLGLADRLGSLAPGRLCDCVHLNDALEVKAVYMGAALVHGA